MTTQDELHLFGRLLSLLGKHGEMSFGEIKHAVRAFIKRKHQTDSSLLDTLDKFVSSGHLKRGIRKGKITFTLTMAAFEPNAIAKAVKTKFQADVIEHGLQEGDEFEPPLTKLARQLAAKPIGQRSQE